MNPLQYVAIAFAVMLIGLGVKYNMLQSDYDSIVVAHAKQIKKERDKVKILEAKNAVSLANEATFKGSIKYLNDIIAKDKVDLDAKTKEFADWKAKPKEEKYKKLYEQLKEIKETEDDCQRYENTSDVFADFDLNEL